MRTRLLTTYVLLLCMVLLALEVPLAISLTNRETQRVLADRLADATRFASLAGPVLTTGELAPVVDELERYHEVYGIASVLLDQGQRVQSAVGIATLLLDERQRVLDADGQPLAGTEQTPVAIRGALAGRQVSTPETLWPWLDLPLVVAVPVTDEGAVVGALVTFSPTGRNRTSVALLWLELGVGGLVAVAAGVVAAARLAGWVLRPVTRLDAAAHEIAAGQGAARVPPGLGPPELRRLSVSFNEMADAVAEALERQRQFVAHASHQLRNPLTVLRLRVEDLGTRLDGEDLADHQMALDETDRLADVLDGLLALARAERGRLRTEVVEAVAIVLNRCEAWRPLAERRGIALEAVVPEGPCFARAVATALDQALDALIDNALKFTPAGGRVEVTLTRTDDGVETVVRDDGPGMTAEQCRDATERFWRAPDAQNVDGAGLGLSIVMALIEASGGEVTLSPVDGGGLAAGVLLRA